jgi:hypothetical protein
MNISERPWRFQEEGEEVYIVPRTRRPSLDFETSCRIFEIDERPSILDELDELDSEIEDIISDLDKGPKTMNGRVNKTVKRSVKYRNIVGGPFHGNYDGHTCGFEDDGRFFIKEGPDKDYLEMNCQSLWEIFRTMKPKGGLFKVTGDGSLVTPMFIEGKGSYRRIYLGKASEHGIYL